MKLSKQLTTVTPFSKYLALFLFISLPFVGFYLGIHYQKSSTIPPIQPTTTIPILNRKTYTSSNYLFKYPADGLWKTSEGIQPAGQYVTLTCSPHCSKDSYITFSVEPLIYKTLDSYKASGLYADLSDTQDIVLAQESAIKGANPGIAGGGYCCSRLIYFVVHNGIGYQITYDFPKPNLSNLSQFPTPNPDILSTFKFIN